MDPNPTKKWRIQSLEVRQVRLDQLKLNSLAD
jgi:hypothetical protein